MTEQVPSKDQLWSDARIRDELRDYDPSLSQQHVAEIFRQALRLIERSAPQPPVVEATNGFGISAMWCAVCGSKEGDSHLVGCPYAGAAQPPGNLP